MAAIVVLAKRTECKFAVKSGGHAAFAGASNIQDGITIDLQYLNKLTVSGDKTVTRVGPGNRWIDVYEYLTPKELSVVGGRVAEIGVGGLIMGGGISFFSGRYGWALDGVRNFELVTASGEILQVNYDSYPDLYWALRGGGNNFGIVTRFDMETFPQAGMWGGMMTTAMDTNDTLLDAFVDFAYNAPQDVDSCMLTAFCWVKDYGVYLVSTHLAYARPVENPAIFENYTSIPTVDTQVKLNDMVGLTKELNESNPNGLRQKWFTATFKVSREMVQIPFDVYLEEMEAIKDVEGVLPALIYQPITTDVISRFAKNGGNCLGIEESEGPLLNINIAIMWKNAADDGLIEGAAKRVIDRSMEKAEEIGMAHRYLYQNYADISQDVFGGYGEENRQRLREISLKYDPDQVFQKLQPGYFKL